MTKEHALRVVAELYGDEPEGDEHALFMLLVDVADLYVRELEDMSSGSEDPAPFLGVTPMEAAMRGLRENLDMIRGDVT